MISSTGKTGTSSIYKSFVGMGRMVKNRLLTKDMQGKQIENCTELWKSEKLKLAVTIDLFRNYQTKTTPERKEEFTQSIAKQYSTAKQTCLTKFVKEIETNQITGDFFDNSDLIALSFLNSDDKTFISEDFINSMLTDTTKFEKLQRHITQNPSSPFKSLYNKIHHKKYISCSNVTPFTDKEVDELLNTIARDSMRAFLDNVGGPLRDSWLACSLAHVITESSATDFFAFIVGVLGLGGSITALLSYSNVMFFMVENIILLYAFEMQKVAFGSNNEHE